MSAAGPCRRPRRTLANWEITNLCPNGGSCIIQPGHYYLVQEAAGTSVNTVALPAADVTGIIAMGAGSGKIALVANHDPAHGQLPHRRRDRGFRRLRRHRLANCSEGTTRGTRQHHHRGIRKRNGCIDTDNNANDLVIGGPTPRNSASPVNFCGGDPTRISGTGSATPLSVDPAGALLLTVTVTPATTPPSTGIAVTGNLTSIGGSASAAVLRRRHARRRRRPATTSSPSAPRPRSMPPLASKSIQTTITDAQPRSADAPITITVQISHLRRGTLGRQDRHRPASRFSRSAQSRTHHDPGAAHITAPVLNPNPPYDPRFAPTEFSVFIVNGISLPTSWRTTSITTSSFRIRMATP